MSDWAPSADVTEAARANIRPPFNLHEQYEVIGLAAKEGGLLASCQSAVLRRVSDGSTYLVSIDQQLTPGPKL